MEKKGVIYLIDSIKSLIQEYPGIELIIVGDGPDKTILEERANLLGVSKHIQFNGAVTQVELPEIYSSATIVVVPSVVDQYEDQEGLGLVAIEAMGCGCAVIASSLDAIQEVIQDNKNGILVKPGNTDGIVTAIRMLLSDEELRARLMKTARQSVIEKYDWAPVADRYRDLLTSMAE